MAHRKVLPLPGQHVELARNPVFADNLPFRKLGPPLAAQAREVRDTTTTVGPPADGP